MVNISSMDIVVIICYTLVCAALLSVGSYLLYKSRGQAKKVRNYLIGISIFFILYGIARVMVFTFELTFPNDFVWNISASDFEEIFKSNSDIALRHDITWRFTTGIGTAGLAILMFELEDNILERKSKFIITIITIVTVIPSLILGVEGKDEIGFVRFILYVGNFMVVFIPLIYFYLALKTSGPTRKRAIGAMIGILIFFFGIIWNSAIGKSLFEGSMGIAGIHLSYVLFCSFVVVGMIIYMKSIQYS